MGIPCGGRVLGRGATLRTVDGPWSPLENEGSLVLMKAGSTQYDEIYNFGNGRDTSLMRHIFSELRRFLDSFFLLIQSYECLSTDFDQELLFRSLFNIFHEHDPRISIRRW